MSRSAARSDIGNRRLMSIAAVAIAPRAYVPLQLAGRPLWTKFAAVAGATLFLAVCSWITVPLVPVPVTMQTFGVTLVGAVFGWRLGAIAVLAWLVEAVMGLPVLAGFASGFAHFTGPTGGYLIAFPITAALVGFCAERGMTVRNLGLSVALMLVANALILLLGAAWLAEFVGSDKAVMLGVTPFLLGGGLKAALATATIEAARRHLPI